MKLQPWAPRIGRDINDADDRVVMIPADDGGWYARHDVEHLVETLQNNQSSGFWGRTAARETGRANRAEAEVKRLTELLNKTKADSQ